MCEDGAGSTAAAKTRDFSGSVDAAATHWRLLPCSFAGVETFLLKKKMRNEVRGTNKQGHCTAGWGRGCVVNTDGGRRQALEPAESKAETRTARSNGGRIRGRVARWSAEA